MLYLDYAKHLAGGGYILSFFADSAADLESISHGQKFVTKNGTDYGVPQAGSTVIVTSPNSGKTTYVMDAEGVWVVTEDISYSAVVANPSDAATAKLEKLKVNDTTYANWTENEIKALAGGGGKVYVKIISGVVVSEKIYRVYITIYSSDSNKTLPRTLDYDGVGYLTIDNKGYYPIEHLQLATHEGRTTGYIYYYDSIGGSATRLTLPVTTMNNITMTVREI